ncbi:MAG: hypothetical protein IJS43_04900 [Bacteroidaceae bacterium]|nr:hypothetical protein [Bacteroidaceae bacterium]
MKKNFLAIFALVVYALTSCSNDIPQTRNVTVDKIEIEGSGKEILEALPGTYIITCQKIKADDDEYLASVTIKFKLIKELEDLWKLDENGEYTDSATESSNGVKKKLEVELSSASWGGGGLRALNDKGEELKAAFDFRKEKLGSEDEQEKKLLELVKSDVGTEAELTFYFTSNDKEILSQLMNETGGFKIKGLKCEITEETLYYSSPSSDTSSSTSSSDDDNSGSSYSSSSTDSDNGYDSNSEDDSDSYDSSDSGDESSDDDNSSSSSRSKKTSTNWDSVLNSYEQYVNQYIAFYKKAKNGDQTALAQYPALLQKANELESKLNSAKGEMTTAQMARYNRINAKLMQAAAGM